MHINKVLEWKQKMFDMHVKQLSFCTTLYIIYYIAKVYLIVHALYINFTSKYLIEQSTTIIDGAPVHLGGGGGSGSSHASICFEACT